MLFPMLRNQRFAHFFYIISTLAKRNWSISRSIKSDFNNMFYSRLLTYIFRSHSGWSIINQMFYCMLCNLCWFWAFTNLRMSSNSFQPHWTGHFSCACAIHQEFFLFFLERKTLIKISILHHKRLLRFWGKVRAKSRRRHERVSEVNIRRSHRLCLESFSRAKSHENLTPMNHVSRARFATSNSYWEESIMCSDIEMFSTMWAFVGVPKINLNYEHLWEFMELRGSWVSWDLSREFSLYSTSLVSQSGFDIARKLLISIFRMIKHPLDSARTC